MRVGLEGEGGAKKNKNLLIAYKQVFSLHGGGGRKLLSSLLLLCLHKYLSGGGGGTSVRSARCFVSSRAKIVEPACSPRESHPSSNNTHLIPYLSLTLLLLRALIVPRSARGSGQRGWESQTDR